MTDDELDTWKDGVPVVPAPNPDSSLDGGGEESNDTETHILYHDTGGDE